MVHQWTINRSVVAHGWFLSGAHMAHNWFISVSLMVTSGPYMDHKWFMGSAWTNAETIMMGNGRAMHGGLMNHVWTIYELRMNLVGLKNALDVLFTFAGSTFLLRVRPLALAKKVNVLFTFVKKKANGTPRLL